jgi:subtilisin family serine protease
MKTITIPKSVDFNFQSILFSLLFLLIPLLAYSQDLKVVSKPVKIDIQENFGYNTYEFMNDPRAQKIGSNLLAVMKRNEKGMDLRTDKRIHAENNKILIQAFAKSEALAKDLLNSLNSMGMTDGVAFKHVINGMMPFDKIESTMDLPSLRSISLSMTPKANIGSVLSQGDASMGSDQGRILAGVDGSGHKIGILSDSYDSNGGEAAGIASGDLPGPGNPNGFSDPIEVLQDDSGIDEGRAMAELVHDIAPGAKMAFHTAVGGFATFANGILALRDAGCDIIVDDISYFAQPYFQDDIIAQAANAVVADGAMYFSSAGNSRNNSYDEGFNPSGFLYDFGSGLVYEPHDWGGDNYFLEVTLQPGQGLNLWLQWDNPSLFAGPLGPEQDLDILIFNESLNTIIDASILCNAAIGAPVELIQGGNGGITPLVIKLFVGRFGPIPGNPNRIKFVDYQGSNIGQYFENSAQWNKGTVVGHPKSEGAIAVGAAAYFNTPAFGTNPPLINAFSSVGGVPSLFDEAGNRLPTADIRLKPDLTGPDGANNTFFGNDFEPDGPPNFFGTSASAPHVAALAALIKEAAPQGASNIIIEYILKETAIDMNDPRGLHSNLSGKTFDYATGYGLVNGLAAIEIALAIEIPTLGQWGIICLTLILLVFGVVVVRQRKLIFK